MAEQKVVDYIIEQRKAGFPDNEIREALIVQGGWSPGEVDAGFRVAGFIPVKKKKQWLPRHRRFIETLFALSVLGMLLVYAISYSVPPAGLQQQAGNTIFQEQGTEPAIVYNYCGEDEDCFRGFAVLCKPSKIALRQELAEGPAFYIQTVDGIENDKCAMELFYVSHPDLSVAGKKMKCLIPVGSLGIYNDWLSGNRLDGCEGDLIGTLYS